MSTSTPIPAAQYLRMSTEEQQYSFLNQAAAIEGYAKVHAFEVVKSYSDPAKSGLVLKRRFGLQQLLRDVVSGNAGFLAILVYDVSRWGRFQDCDEAAHYEFLCKQAGIPVHYCAEPFANDGTLPNMILKWLKRTMAGEYSRELSEKVFNGHVRLARLGFKQGGAPGFGLRRMLIGPDQHPKQILNKGERKCIASDRVILVPGPEYEVRWVQRIYAMLLEEGRSPWWIAGELNRQRVQRSDNSHPWRYGSVVSILTHPKYVGCNVYGRHTQRLGALVRSVPESQWILTPGAYQPIISKETFDKAQAILRNRTIHQTNEALLDALRTILLREGRLSQNIIANAPEFPACHTTLRARFGSLRKAYERVGYGSPEHFCGHLDQRRRSIALRDRLIAQLQELFPGRLTLIQGHPLRRIRLRLPSGLVLSVCMSRCFQLKTGNLRWYLAPIKKERRLMTLLARLDAENLCIQDMFILPSVDRRKLFWLKPDDEWLNRGSRLERLCDFFEVVEAVRLQRFADLLR
jgi:DNA invertase Pin-like site-specific DNA recombinase